MSYKHLRSLARLAARQGIGTNALLTLIHISEKENGEGIRIGTIAEEFGISTAAATGIADTLEKRGLAERTHAKQGDRRVITLTITEEGRKAVAECQTISPT